MTDEKAARLAAIRAANAQKAAAGTGPSAAGAGQQAAPRSTPSQPSPQAPGAVQRTMVEPEPSVEGAGTLLTLLLAAVVGAFAAVVVVPRWLPGLSSSLLGAEPKAYWYLARSSAVVAFGLLWLSMAAGLCITSKVTRLWLTGPTLFDVHQFTGLLALAFALFHSLILLGDAYIDYTLVQVLIPFTSQGFRPFAVGLGQLCIWLLALVGLSVYARPWIGRRVWRIIHALSFVVFLLALAHGILSGTDTSTSWMQALYWGSSGSLLFLASFRVVVAGAVRWQARRAQHSTRPPRAQQPTAHQ